jgi:hypothetical protein
MREINFLQRYEAGEHEAVWADMMALGRQVRERPYLADAFAVARETMRRARHNVEAIIERLDALGYHFWDGVQGPRREPLRKVTLGARKIEASSLDGMLSAMFEEARSLPPEALTPVMIEQLHNIYRLAVWPWQDTSRLARGERHPADAAATALFEQAKKTPPTAVATTLLADMDRQSRVAMNQLRTAWNEREGSRVETPKTVDHRKDQRVFQGVHADPLMVAIDMSEIEEWMDEAASSAGRRSMDVVVGWDAKAKARLTVENVELDYGYTLAIPSGAADAILAGRTPAMNFVDYLRLAFRWGGFPGWAGEANPPRQELEFLTQGLLPL